MKVKMVPITNTSAAFLHVGGKVIAPGDTRHVDASMVPPDLLPKDDSGEAADAPAAPANPMAELAQGTIAQIVPELPNLSDDDLLSLEAIELEGGNRKGLIDAIEAEKLERATKPPPQA